MEPTTLDNINHHLEGCILKVLTKDDVIHENDFIRPLYEDNWIEGGFDSTFKPNGWKGTRWHRVSIEFGGWVDKTQLDYWICINSKKEPYNAMYEIVRVIEME